MQNEEEPVFEVKMRDREGRWWKLDVEDWLVNQRPTNGRTTRSSFSESQTRGELPPGHLRLTVRGEVRLDESAAA